MSILSALEHRIASPSQLADELGVPLPNLSYHIRMLVQLDLLKLVKTRPRRGAIEHYYQAKGPVIVSDKAWGQVPTLVKESILATTLHRVGKDIDAAAASGGFDDPESVLARQSVKLDEQAWKKLSEKLIELDQFASQLQAESDKRRKDSDHLDEIEADVVLMMYKKAPVEAAQLVAEADGTPHKRATRSRTRKREQV